jgi:flagellar hook-associated protein 3 FlgL
MRLTNAIMYNNALFNLNLQNQQMLQDSQQASSGKAINSPSDNPIGAAQSIQFQSTINFADQYMTLGQQATGNLSTAEGAITTVNDIMANVVGLATQAANGTQNADTRKITATSIDSFLQQIIQIGNTKIGSNFIFGGRQTNVPPVNDGGQYVGDSQALSTVVNTGNQSVQSSVLASDFLTANLSPELNSGTVNPTKITSLRGGNGISVGTFTITDRASAPATTATMTATGGSPNITLSGNAAAYPIGGVAQFSSSAKLPTGLSANTPYYVISNSGGATPTIQVSATPGGSAIVMGDSGLGTASIQSGKTKVVTIAPGSTLNDVMNAINNPPYPAVGSVNITAQLSADGTGIQIKDNNLSGINGPIAIVDTTGTAAAGLGIAGTKNVSTFNGDNLAPVLDANTALNDLYGGKGITLSDINIYNGGVSKTVSFNGAKTIGDVINTINNCGANVSAAINSVGNALTLTSLDPQTVAYSTDINSGTTAAKLGIGGGSNLVTTMQKLSAAMKANDGTAISGLLTNINSGITSISNTLGTIGARINVLSNVNTMLTTTKTNTTQMFADVMNADMAKVLSEFTQLQTSYQATSKVTAQLLQPGLIAYL